MTNKFITDDHTESLQKLVKEIVNDPSTYLGSKYLPSTSLPVEKVRVEVIEASGGLTKEHLPGTDPQYIQSFGTRVQEYEPAFYKEAIHYDEKKLLFLRKLGQNDRSQRGIRQYIDNDVDRLNRRIEARIEKQRWDVIFNGGFSWMGQTLSFGVPGANNVTPDVVWSSDGEVANNSANPIQDLRYWLLGGYAGFRKYKFQELVMNPNTVRFILDNSGVRSYLTSYGASSALAGGYDINTVLKLLIPGLPPVTVYDGWYQEESVDANGKISVANASYFIPDGKIFLVPSNLPGGDKIGEFVQTLHLASGSLDDPGFGKFLVIDENIAQGTKGGPKNPFIDIVGGVYGGVKLDRPFDLLTVSVL